ncbi:amphi-Trp domain-containing protein [Natrarchaeobius oligotrophus]|uniref:DUF1508 domain-containing protein n=1 Tax=Natrarchaeobius chitinivorans TaxID=1679083 RepID=A0A3N6M8Z2_NATCH|nr:amphi-Trp domain-containing protein [Natrarchaeobius chitinivorans]RQG98847.1 DUF1508 domain-containing protein [Natrarchaeobius chitinivorans]
MTDPPTEFEFERAYDRDDLAEVFRTLADALESGDRVRLSGADASASVAVPPRVVAEFELERESGEPAIAELEIDLEWEDADGSSIRIGDESAGEGDRVAVRADPPGSDPASEASTAAIPPTAVTERGESSEPNAASGSEKRRSRFEVYEDRADEWRWRLVHWNGNVIGDSGEGYASKRNATRAVKSVIRAASTAHVVELEE